MIGGTTDDYGRPLNELRCLSVDPGNQETACGRARGHDGAHCYHFTGYLGRQDPRVTCGSADG